MTTAQSVNVSTAKKRAQLNHVCLLLVKIRSKYPEYAAKFVNPTAVIIHFIILDQQKGLNLIPVFSYLITKTFSQVSATLLVDSAKFQVQSEM